MRTTEPLPDRLLRRHLNILIYLLGVLTPALSTSDRSGYALRQDRRLVNEDISGTSIFLNMLAIVGFIFFARTPPQTTTEIFWIAGAALTVFGTALAALAIKREGVRVLSAVLFIVVIVALRVAL